MLIHEQEYRDHFKARHGGIERQSVASLTIGDYSAVFLIGSLGLGLLAPLLFLTAGLIVPLDIGSHAFLYYGAMVLELGGIYGQVRDPADWGVLADSAVTVPAQTDSTDFFRGENGEL